MVATEREKCSTDFSVSAPGGPKMVWVFPDPVWPYAIRVQLYPWCKRSSSGAAMASNAAAWSQSPSIMLAKPSCTTDPSLGRWTKTPPVVAKTAGLSEGLMRTVTVTIAASSSAIRRRAELGAEVIGDTLGWALESL